MSYADFIASKDETFVGNGFAGIGSEGYCSVRMGRKFVGFELKESYFKQAALNLRAAEHRPDDLFAQVAE